MANWTRTLGLACLGASIGCGSHAPPEGSVRVSAVSEALSWSVSPETRVSAPTTPEQIPAQFGMAADPNGFLLTWVDELIESTYVSNSGAIASPFGKVLANESTRRKPDFTPSVIPAFNGQFYLVAWIRFVPNPLGPDLPPVSTQIVAMRVSTSGEPLDAAPIVISTQDSIVMIDTLLSDGAGFFVAWQEATPGTLSPEQGRFVSFTGDSPDLSPIVDFGFPHSYRHFFTFDGSKYVVAYFRNFLSTGFTVRRFTSAGLDSQPTVYAPGTNCSGGEVTVSALTSHGGGESLVVYRSDTYDATTGGCRPSVKALQLGENLQPKFAPIVLTTSDPYQPAVHLGGKYFAAGLQIDPATNVASPTTLQVREPLACNDTGCVMQYGGAVSRITLQGAPLDPATIEPSSGSSFAGYPMVVSGAGEFLVVWKQAAVIHARRVSTSGTPLDPLPLVIVPPSSAYGELLGVAFNGTDFLVRWWSSDQYRLTRVSPEGIVKDPVGIAIPGYVSACRANECLLAWTGPGVSVSRLGADGSLLDSPPIQVLPSSDLEGPLTLATSATGYVLQYGYPGSGTVRLDTTGHPIGSPMPGSSQDMQPCGSNFLIFTPLPSDPPGQNNLYRASLVDWSGSVLVSNVELGGPINYGFDVASRATDCVVAWPKPGLTGTDVYASFVADDGSGVSPQPIPLATDQFSERYPALAFDGDRLLVAYSHLVPEPPYGNYAIGARIATNAEGGAGTGGVGGSPSTSGGSPSTSGGSSSTSGGPSSAGSVAIGGSPSAGGGVGDTGGIGELGGNGGTAGNGGSAGLDGVAGIAGLAASGTGGSGGLGSAAGGTAGLGDGALGGTAFGGDGNAAGALDSYGGSSGQDSGGGASGEPASSTAGTGMTGGHAGSSSNMIGGRAGTAGNGPEPESCSCRIVGDKPAAANHLPAFAGLLLALGTALSRRRSSPRP